MKTGGQVSRCQGRQEEGRRDSVSVGPPSSLAGFSRKKLRLRTRADLVTFADAAGLLQRFLIGIDVISHFPGGPARLAFPHLPTG